MLAMFDNMEISVTKKLRSVWPTINSDYSADRSQ